MRSSYVNEHFILKKEGGGWKELSREGLQGLGDFFFSFLSGTGGGCLPTMGESQSSAEGHLGALIKRALTLG